MWVGEVGGVGWGAGDGAGTCESLGGLCVLGRFKCFETFLKVLLQLVGFILTEKCGTDWIPWGTSGYCSV